GVPVEGVPRGEAPRDALHLRSGRADRRAGCEASDDLDETSVGRLPPWAVSIELIGGPQVDILPHEAEAGGHHADDLVREIVELDRAADCAPIATELVLPGAIAEHGNAWAVRTVVLIGDRAAKERSDAEQRKEFR